MNTKTVMELFCDGCPWYKPEWDAMVEQVSLPCKYEHICNSNARKVAAVEDK
jgi:hypothetical protein